MLEGPEVVLLHCVLGQDIGEELCMCHAENL